MDLTDFFCDFADLNRIDWPLIAAKWWNDTNDDPDRSRRRQAEFLVHRFFPWDLVTEIGVANAQAATRVNTAISSARHVPAVIVRQAWYY